MAVHWKFGSLVIDNPIFGCKVNLSLCTLRLITVDRSTRSKMQSVTALHWRQLQLQSEAEGMQLEVDWKGLVLQYQLHNRVENLADVSTRCSGLLQGEDDDDDLRPEEDQSIWSKRRQSFQPCCEAGIGEPTLSDA